MPAIDTVEQTITNFEGFKIKFLYLDGSDVRGDLRDIPQYNGYSNKAADTMTVTAWIERRFKSSYPEFRVVVLDAGGNPVHGQTKLSTVRATYNNH